jgi:hypothetical protein
MPWNERDHKERPKVAGFFPEDPPYCDSCFDHVFISGQSYTVEDERITRYCPSDPNQTAVSLQLFATRDPRCKLVDEPGCINVGSLIVQMPIPDRMKNASLRELGARRIQFKMKYKGNRFLVFAEDVTNGETFATTINFLN